MMSGVIDDGRKCGFGWKWGPRVFLGAVICVLLSGCITARYSVSVYTKDADLGERIVTKNRYFLYAYIDDKSSDIQSSKARVNHRKAIAQRLRPKFERLQPDVFSESGIPIVIDYTKPELRTSDGVRFGLSLLWYLASLGTLPLLDEETNTKEVFLPYVGGVKDASEIALFGEHKVAGTAWSPIGLMYSGLSKDVTEGCTRTFTVHTWTRVGSEEKTDTMFRAMVYGVAARLKELEDAGELDNLPEPSLSTNRPQRVNVVLPPRKPSAEVKPMPPPAYKIVRFKRETENGLSYRFTLELKESGDVSLQAFHAVQRELRVTISDDCVESSPGTRAESLHVEFPEFELKGQRIEGRAVVLAIAPVSFAYDEKTRRGRLSVRVDAGQYEGARALIRRHIEELVRKNIVTSPDKAPTAVKYILDKEELKDGNILEVEFRVE